MSKLVMLTEEIAVDPDLVILVRVIQYNRHIVEGSPEKHVLVQVAIPDGEFDGKPMFTSVQVPGGDIRGVVAKINEQRSSFFSGGKSDQTLRRL